MYHHTALLPSEANICRPQAFRKHPEIELLQWKSREREKKLTQKEKREKNTDANLQLLTLTGVTAVIAS